MTDWYKTFSFEPIRVPVLVRETADVILESVSSGRTSTRVSLDLGFSQSVVTFRDHLIELPDGSTIELDDVKNVKERGVYIVQRDGLQKAAFFSGDRYYQLVSTGPESAPTIEISGIHMHRIKGITPWEDSREKVKAVGIFQGAKIFDIGTGLGYTAILATRFGASSVLTVEHDENVLRMAEVNPWSRELADERIKIVLADATEFVGGLRDSSFHRVIHDPPRFSLAGELYSSEFYHQLFRVLKPGGNLFHYVGEPGKIRGKKMVAGILSRLKDAGFIVPKQKAQGIVIRKPK